MTEGTQGGESAHQQGPPNLSRQEPPKSQVGKLWDAFGNPEAPVNVHPGANYNPRHEKPKDVTVSESLKSISLSEFSTFHKKPCARDSLMIGLGTGFGIGGVRGIVGGETGCVHQSFRYAFL